MNTNAAERQIGMKMKYVMSMSIKVTAPSSGRTIAVFPDRDVHFASTEYCDFDASEVIAEATRHVRDAVASIQIIDAEDD